MLHNVKEGWNTFKSIFTGMGVTMKHLFQPSVTLQYPDVREELPANARAKLYVDIDDCIGCNLCARACPVNCIDIETVMSTDDVDLGKTSTGNPKRFWLTRFDIDMAKCMYCDLCVHPCPTDCIKMVQEYEYSEFDRTNLVYHFSNLTPEMVADVKEKAALEAEEKKRKREEAKRKKQEEKKRKAAEAKKKDSKKTDPSESKSDKGKDSPKKNSSDNKGS